MVEIRTIKTDDLTDLGMLYAQLTGQVPHPERVKSVFTLIQKDPSYYLLGAFKENVLAGSVMGIVCYDLVEDCLPFMVVENVVVFDSFRGQGVGRALMQEAERIAKTRECAYVMFVSGAQRKEAHQFYRAMGYSMDRVQGFKKELTD